MISSSLNRTMILRDVTVSLMVRVRVLIPPLLSSIFHRSFTPGKLSATGASV